jgi:hypothetical protein
MHIDRPHRHGRLAKQADVDGLLRFIAIRWADLARSNYALLDLAIDPKWPRRAGEKWIVYVKDEDPVEIRRQLAAMNPASDMDLIDVLDLPDGAVSLPRQGALYLPCAAILVPSSLRADIHVQVPLCRAGRAVRRDVRGVPMPSDVR